MKRIRIALNTLAVILVLGGFGLTLIRLAFRPASDLHREYPLYTVYKISIDSSGNIYYGLGEINAIQVYDNFGNFLYSFVYNDNYFTKGSSNFYVDELDDVLVLNHNKLDIYNNGVLVSTSEDNGRYDEMKREYDMKYLKSSYDDDDGNGYVFIGKYSVQIIDKNGDLLRTIAPSTPIWPLSIEMCIGIAFMGALFLIGANFKQVFGQRHTIQRTGNVITS